MTNKEAFLFAKAEIASFDYAIKEVNLEFPKAPTKDVFFSFFIDENTGEAYCRTYLYVKRIVSFVKIKNFKKLQAENPTLVEAYLENGKYLYRNSRLIEKTNFDRKGNVFKLNFNNQLESIPV